MNKDCLANQRPETAEIQTSVTEIYSGLWNPLMSSFIGFIDNLLSGLATNVQNYQESNRRMDKRTDKTF